MSLGFALSGLLTFGVIAQGGFYPAQTWTLALVALALAYLSRFEVRASLVGTDSRPAIAAVCAVTGGLAVSSLANGVGSWAPFATVAAAVGVLAVTVALEGSRQLLLQGLVIAGSVVAATAISGVLFHIYPLAVHQFHVWRGAGTLTYPNAAALLFTMSIGAAALLARREPDATLPRLALWLTSTALILTFSRGALVAGVIAIAVLVACGGRDALRSFARPGIAAAIAVAGMIPTITNDGAQPLPGILGVLLGCAVMLAPPVRSRAVKLTACALGVAVLSVAALPLASHARRLVDSRASASSANRALYWRAAASGLGGHLALGRGPGKMDATVRMGTEDVNFRFAHEEPLQILADTGVVGLGSVVVAASLLAWWAWRRRPRAGSPHRAEWAVAVAACAAFVVHGAFDFVWHIPILVVIAFVWLGIAVTCERPGLDQGGTS